MIKLWSILRRQIIRVLAVIQGLPTKTHSSICFFQNGLPNMMCHKHQHERSQWKSPTGADLGRGCRGCAPPLPPREMTCGFLIQLVFCQKKIMWFIGVEVEQETSAPPPKKNPGSAPDPKSTSSIFFLPYSDQRLVSYCPVQPSCWRDEVPWWKTDCAYHWTVLCLSAGLLSQYWKGLY